MPRQALHFTPSLTGRALRYLAQREYSRAELERKLTTHAESPEQLAQTLDALQSKGFINEARVAQSLLNRRAARLGTARLRQELKNKGLDAQTVAQALQTLQSSELERAQQVWQKKFGALADLDDASQRAKQARFLSARGFTSEVIYRVLARSDVDETSGTL